MAFTQYLTDGVPLHMADSYRVRMSNVKADSSSETQTGTTQRDVVKMGVASIPVMLSVSPKWIKLLTGFKQKEKLLVD